MEFICPSIRKIQLNKIETRKYVSNMEDIPENVGKIYLLHILLFSQDCKDIYQDIYMNDRNIWL